MLLDYCILCFAYIISCLFFTVVTLGKKIKDKENIILKPSPTFLLYHRIKKEEHSMN